MIDSSMDRCEISNVQEHLLLKFSRSSPEVFPFARSDIG